MGGEDFIMAASGGILLDWSMECLQRWFSRAAGIFQKIYNHCKQMERSSHTCFLERITLFQVDLPVQ